MGHWMFLYLLPAEQGCQQDLLTLGDSNRTLGEPTLVDLLVGNVLEKCLEHSSLGPSFGEKFSFLSSLYMLVINPLHDI
jgi:hypothetical protein